MSERGYTTNEIHDHRGGAAAENGAVCFVGWITFHAANLASLTHGSDIVLIMNRDQLAQAGGASLSIGDGNLAKQRRIRWFPPPEIFRDWCREAEWTWDFLARRRLLAREQQYPGDRRLQKAQDTLHGAGGAPEIASWCWKKSCWYLKQTARAS